MWTELGECCLQQRACLVLVSAASHCREWHSTESNWATVPAVVRVCPAAVLLRTCLEMLSLLQVRQLMDRRQSPGWQFSTLFLVKDSLAVMLESAHLYEDALREYSELEACYLEALAAGGPLSQQTFGLLPALCEC